MRRFALVVAMLMASASSVDAASNRLVVAELEKIAVECGYSMTFYFDPTQARYSSLAVLLDTAEHIVKVHAVASNTPLTQLDVDMALNQVELAFMRGEAMFNPDKDNKVEREAVNKRCNKGLQEALKKAHAQLKSR